MKKINHWTKKEISILLKNKNKSISELMALFPNRTQKAIANKRIRMRISVGNPLKNFIKVVGKTK